MSKIQERKDKKLAINNSRTQAEKFKTQSEYAEANKEKKKSIKAEKQKYMGVLATTAEKASREGNMKQLYETTKKLAGRYSNWKNQSRKKAKRQSRRFKNRGKDGQNSSRNC